MAKKPTIQIIHEVKTSAVNIMGYSKLLLRGEYGELNDGQKARISDILIESERIMLIE